MKQLFLLFSHTLTNTQKTDAKNRLHVERFITLQPDLQKLWSNIPEDSTEINSYLQPLKKYLKLYAKPDDFIFIQGDFGGVYDMVNYSKNIGLIPIHSTTKREAEEQTIGSEVKKISTFKHVIYRKY